MEIKNLEWGVDYGGKEYSDSLTCPNHDCERSKLKLDYIVEKYHASIAVGVRKGNKDSRPFIITCECPSCFAQYYFHITTEEAERLANSRKVPPQ